jgi:hypothetical protein
MRGYRIMKVCIEGQKRAGIAVLRQDRQIRKNLKMGALINKP